MIEARELTKRYGDTHAVHSLSVTIAPGTVTGFLGPNGAGKSTTMRMITGLGPADFGHRHRQRQALQAAPFPAAEGRRPTRRQGHAPRRSARSHLRTTAATHNIKTSRVSEVIEMTGLAGAATKRVGGFSLGMGQRLGIAATLPGGPRDAHPRRAGQRARPRGRAVGSASSCAPWPPKNEPSSSPRT